MFYIFNVKVYIWSEVFLIQTAFHRQARNFTTNVPEIIDLKSSSEQIFSEN